MPIPFTPPPLRRAARSGLTVPLVGGTNLDRTSPSIAASCGRRVLAAPNTTRGVPEARLEDSGSGLAPADDGWFVVNVRDAAVADVGERREAAVRLGVRVREPASTSSRSSASDSTSSSRASRTGSTTPSRRRRRSSCCPGNARCSSRARSGSPAVGLLPRSRRHRAHLRGRRRRAVRDPDGRRAVGGRGRCATRCRSSRRDTARARTRRPPTRGRPTRRFEPRGASGPRTGTVFPGLSAPAATRARAGAARGARSARKSRTTAGRPVPQASTRGERGLPRRPMRPGRRGARRRCSGCHRDGARRYGAPRAATGAFLRTVDCADRTTRAARASAERPCAISLALGGAARRRGTRPAGSTDATRSRGDDRAASARAYDEARRHERIRVADQLLERRRAPRPARRTALAIGEPSTVRPGHRP